MSVLRNEGNDTVGGAIAVDELYSALLDTVKEPYELLEIVLNTNTSDQLLKERLVNPAPAYGISHL